MIVFSSAIVGLLPAQPTIQQKISIEALLQQAFRQARRVQKNWLSALQ
jgi:hypothetical protein